MSDFIAVTDALPPDAAWEALEQALREYSLTPEDLDPDRDVVIDTYRSSSGEVLNRYRVRRSRLESS
jgi:hypothetical protein